MDRINELAEMGEGLPWDEQTKITEQNKTAIFYLERAIKWLRGEDLEPLKDYLDCDQMEKAVTALNKQIV